MHPWMFITSFIPIHTLQTKLAQCIKHHGTYTTLMIYTIPGSNLLLFFSRFILIIEDLPDWIYKLIGIIYKQDIRIAGFPFQIMNF